MELKTRLRFKQDSLHENANSLAVEVYTLTLQFPRHEALVMNPLLRRLSLSIISNVAKGFSAREYKEFLFFITYANASCHGIKFLMKMAKDIGYVTEEQCNSVQEKCANLSREIVFMMKEVERKIDYEEYRKEKRRQR